MRIVKIEAILVLATTIISVVTLNTGGILVVPHYDKVLEKWDELDVKQFLKDRDIKYEVESAVKDGGRYMEQLKALASQELSRLELANAEYEASLDQKYDQAQSFLTSWKDTVMAYISPKKISSEVGKRYAYLANEYNPSSFFGGSKSISDWVFDTWSVEQLKVTLEKNKIKYKTEATKNDLIKLAKKNYHKIAKESKVSGNYPGEWLFSSWSVEDLTNWLKDNHVEVQKRYANDKDYLMKQVRENLYPAAFAIKDSKDDLFESLNMPSKDDLFDQAGKIKKDLYNKWSESQLSSWLESNGVAISEKLKHNKNLLIQSVEDNKKILQSDFDEWLEYLKRKSEQAKEKLPSKEELLSKIPSTDNLVNDTFFVDVEKWPKDRLKAFLGARGISYPYFATKKELVKLVKESKSKKLVNFEHITPDLLFAGWSTDQLKGWLKSNKIEVSDYRDDLVKKLYDLFGELQKLDLQDHAMDLINKGKETAELGKNYAGQVIENIQEPVGDMVTTAKEYGSSLYNYLLSLSTDDLRNYLESFGAKDTSTLNHEQLVARAKAYTHDFFNGDYSWFGQKPQLKKSIFSTEYWRHLYIGMRGY